ncbi:hypothetical protein RO575_02790 [Methylomonas sp. MO1]|uniref:hypothetical protein n=1 Tax=Methylomonas sp. MO1 TaxID=3073619 RepID=UPI0028A2F9CB|nr:hypothetical protein [Methylomonas sp. MO1]MDT4288474.1 hypothetical protein [Methylomonas sp. MO1]
MKTIKSLSINLLAIISVLSSIPSVEAATNVQIGPSGKTFASSMVQCAVNPATGLQAATAQTGLFNPKPKDKATITLNGGAIAKVSAAQSSANVWLYDGNNTVVVALSARTADTYTFTVQPGFCNLPDTSGNTFSADSTLEYAASGKSYTLTTPGCALNPATGNTQFFVNLFDNGSYLLNVSINGTPLTQLNGTTRRSVPIFLGAGLNVISAANGTLSTDYYVRDGGNGICTLP